MWFPLKYCVLILACLVNICSGSEEDPCADPINHNCDTNAHCKEAVSADSTVKVYFCECNEGYEGDGSKGTCKKLPGDAACILNCDFTKSENVKPILDANTNKQFAKSFCTYQLPITKRTFTYVQYKPMEHSDEDQSVETFSYIVTSIGKTTDASHYIYPWNSLSVHPVKHNRSESFLETRVHFTVRLTSPNIKFLVESGAIKATLIDFGSNVKGWQTVTLTLPAKTTDVKLTVQGNNQISMDNPALFGLKKIEVEADNC